MLEKKILQFCVYYTTLSTKPARPFIITYYKHCSSITKYFLLLLYKKIITILGYIKGNNNNNWPKQIKCHWKLQLNEQYSYIYICCAGDFLCFKVMLQIEFWVVQTLSYTQYCSITHIPTRTHPVEKVLQSHLDTP